MMTLTDRRWNIGTILTQSVLLFFITFLLFSLPHLLDDTYEMALEGQTLPAMTHWILNVMPDAMAGILCMTTSVAITNLCIGLILVKTAETAIIATQRTIFLTITTWGITLFSMILLLVALALPFISTIGRLSTVEEMQAVATRSRTWIIWTVIYCVSLIGTTAMICRRKKEVEHMPPEGRGEAPRP